MAGQEKRDFTSRKSDEEVCGVGWGAADASFRSPMAIAVIGGLLTSTVLSLLVIPVVFTYLDDLGQWSGKMLRKLTQTRSKA